MIDGHEIEQGPGTGDEHGHRVRHECRTEMNSLTYVWNPKTDSDGHTIPRVVYYTRFHIIFRKVTTDEYLYVLLKGYKYLYSYNKKGIWVNMHEPREDQTNWSEWGTQRKTNSKWYHLNVQYKIWQKWIHVWNGNTLMDIREQTCGFQDWESRGSNGVGGWG